MLSPSALDELATEIVACRRCPRLADYREEVAAARRGSEEHWGRPVSGFGDPEATLLIVGLAPGADGANRTGRVFTGDPAGDWLFRALYKAGFANQPTSIHREDGLVLSGAYITNAVHCVPPVNKPTRVEEDNCRPYLAREMEALRHVRVVVVLGKKAMRAVAQVLDLSPGPKFAHLSETALPEARTLLCSYHTSRRNTNNKTLTEEMLDAVFTRALDLLTQPVNNA